MDSLQWGNRKRLRCVKVKDSNLAEKSHSLGGGGVPIKKKIASFVDGDNESRPLSHLQSPLRLQRVRGMNGVMSGHENQKTSTMASSPEKEERYYTTRAVGLDDSSSRMFMEAKEEKRAIVWPKLFITLSSKEKEEDFMAMKGCKLPQRPKKRAKLVQKTLLLVSPGAWLSDLCQERYEVREKKTSKKKPRGLKAMGSMESDSE